MSSWWGGSGNNSNSNNDSSSSGSSGSSGSESNLNLQENPDDYFSLGAGSVQNVPPSYHHQGTSNPYAGLDSINPQTFSPMFGQPAIGQKQPDFLYYDQRGRGWVERMFYNVGTAYLVGMATGGAIGVVDGIRSSPSNRTKIVVNSLLNKVGRGGSRLGNALGVLAFLYSSVEWGYEKVDLERKLGAGGEVATPTLAAATTGMIYKSTRGPKTVALAGVFGGSLALVAFGTKTAFPQLQTGKGLLFL